MPSGASSCARVCATSVWDVDRQGVWGVRERFWCGAWCARERTVCGLVDDSSSSPSLSCLSPPLSFRLSLPHTLCISLSLLRALSLARSRSRSLSILIRRRNRHQRSSSSCALPKRGPRAAFSTVPLPGANRLLSEAAFPL